MKPPRSFESKRVELELGGHHAARLRQVDLHVAAQIALAHRAAHAAKHPHALRVRELAAQIVRRRPGQCRGDDGIQLRQVRPLQVQEAAHVLGVGRNHGAVELRRGAAGLRAQAQAIRVVDVLQLREPQTAPFDLQRLAIERTLADDAQGLAVAAGERLQFERQVGARLLVVVAHLAAIDLDVANARHRFALAEVPVVGAIGVALQQHFGVHQPRLDRHAVQKGLRREPENYALRLRHRLLARPGCVGERHVFELDARDPAEIDRKIAIEGHGPIEARAGVARQRPAQRIPRKEEHQQQQRHQHPTGDDAIPHCSICRWRGHGTRNRWISI